MWLFWEFSDRDLHALSLSDLLLLLQLVSTELQNFFSSSMADVALWLGPYMSISSKNVICTKTQKVRKCRQITTNRKSPGQICVSSKKNSKPDTQKGQEPKQKHPQRGFAKGHSGLTTASRSKTCRNELSTTKFSETWKSKHRAYLS